MQLRIIATALLLASGGVQASDETEAPKNLPGIRADDGIRYIDAAAFPDIPNWVRQVLIRERCAIPQTGLDEKSGNVVRGRFLSTNEFSWAAICSRDGRDDTIIVNAAKRVLIVKSARSGGWYETGYGKEYLEYVWVISARAARKAARRHDDYLPIAVRTDGLVLGFAETAAGARFLHRGRWIDVAVSD